MAGERGFSPIRAFDPKDARCSLCGDRSRASTLRASRRETSEDVVVAHGCARARCGARGARPSRLLAGGRLGIAHAGTTGAMLETERDLFAPPASGLRADSRACGSSRIRCAPPPSVSRELRRERRFGRRVCAACARARHRASSRPWSGCDAALVDVALAGGADALCALTFFGFEALGALDPEPCRPFDRARRGLSLGEAGAFLVLEREGSARARGAPILALLLGGSDRSGGASRDASRAERGARRRARAGCACLGAPLPERDRLRERARHRNAAERSHGGYGARPAALGDAAPASTSRPRRDSSGTRSELQPRIEAVVTVLALGHGEVPPTAGLEAPEEPALRHVMGRGPASAAPGRALVLVRFRRHRGRPSVRERGCAAPRARDAGRARVVVTGLAGAGCARAFSTGEELASYLEPEPAAGPGPYEPRSARAARAGALAPLRSRGGVRHGRRRTRARGRDDSTGPDAGLVMGTAFGSVERSVRFVEKAPCVGGPRVASPAEFPAPRRFRRLRQRVDLPRARGPVFAVSDRETSAESALAAAVALLGAGQATAFAAGAVEAFDPIVQAIHASSAGRAAASAAARERRSSSSKARLRRDRRGARMLARIEGPARARRARQWRRASTSRGARTEPPS